MMNEITFKSMAIYEEQFLAGEVALNGLLNFCKELRTEKEVEKIIEMQKTVKKSKRKDHNSVVQYKIARVIEIHAIITDIVENKQYCYAYIQNA